MDSKKRSKIRGKEIDKLTEEEYKKLFSEIYYQAYEEFISGKNPINTVQDFFSLTKNDIAYKQYVETLSELINAYYGPKQDEERERSSLMQKTRRLARGYFLLIESIMNEDYEKAEKINDLLKKQFLKLS